MAFWFLIALVATVALQILLAPKPRVENQRPPGLGDFTFPTATEARPVPLLFGRNKISGPNVVWYGDLSQDPITQSIKTNLFFGSKKQVIGFRERVGMQFALCRGTINAVTKVWVADKLVFDSSSTTTIDIDEPMLFGGDTNGTGGVQATLDIFLGTSSQSVSSYLALHQDLGDGSTPRYRGTCYLVFRELSVAAGSARGGYIGNSTNVPTFAFEVERYPATFSGQGGSDNRIGNECNPANVLYELLTNTEWGFGRSATEIDVGASSTFKDASDTLITEANGFALVWDMQTDRATFRDEVLRQIDGVLDINPSTGKWELRLIRDDYNINTVPELTEANCTVQNFGAVPFNKTSNIVTCEYFKREDEYQQTYAIAIDTANQLIQGGGSLSTIRRVPDNRKYPGVKTSANAAKIVWRDLRTLAYPLRSATVSVDRSFWDVRRGDVLAYSLDGFTKLPMRVNSVGLGDGRRNTIKLVLIQDVFRFAAASFAPPAATGWTAPTQAVSAAPSTEQTAFEAPRAIMYRDPEGALPDGCKVLTAIRKQGAASWWEIRERHSAGTPSGAYASAGQGYVFTLIGVLQASISPGSAVPLSTLIVSPSPDTQSRILATLQAASVTEAGQQLVNLLVVGTEFMVCLSAQANGSNVQLNNVYRGVMDSVQQSHTAGDAVFLIGYGAALTDTLFTNTDNVDIKLLPNSVTSSVSEAAATTIALTMAKRALRPYPPADVSIQGSRYASAPSLEGAGAAANTYRLDFTWLRRAFQTAEGGDEIAALGTDAATLFPGFPTTNSTEYRLSVNADPTGANTLVFQSGWVDGSTAVQVLRNEILQGGAVGTLLRVTIETRHDYGAEVDLAARHNLTFDFTPTSALSGLFYLGARSSGNFSNTYTTAATGTFTVNIGAAYSTANVQYKLNGGSATTVIAAGGTTGTIPGVTSGDTIQLDYTATDSPDPNYVEILNPSAVRVAYGVFAS